MSLALLTASLPSQTVAPAAFAQEPQIRFRSGVELVRVSTVVRDRRGRFVAGLTAKDFDVIDGGVSRTILSTEPERAAVSLALLFDVSGSMEGRQAWAREMGTHVLGWLDRDADEAAVYTFDTRLDEIAPFTIGLTELPATLSSVTPFGATSLHDAIARTAERLAGREGRRRAVVVLTDGLDTASRLTPPEVSAIASAIDAPIYIVGLVPRIDDPTREPESRVTAASALAGSLDDLATWTGGRVLVASTPAARATAARAIVDELRQQYVIVFEAGEPAGWHPLEVRVRNERLVVQARAGYVSGRRVPSFQ
jgi:Ca-activated chloride channel family protein